MPHCNETYNNLKRNNLKRIYVFLIIKKHESTTSLILNILFVQLVGSTGKPNTGQKLRLQLFRPPSNAAPISNEGVGQVDPVFLWWKDYMRAPYPSTLYVSLKAVVKPNKV